MSTEAPSADTLGSIPTTDTRIRTNRRIPEKPVPSPHNSDDGDDSGQDEGSEESTGSRASLPAPPSQGNSPSLGPAKRRARTSSERSSDGDNEASDVEGTPPSTIPGHFFSAAPPLEASPGTPPDARRRLSLSSEGTPDAPAKPATAAKEDTKGSIPDAPVLNQQDIAYLNKLSAAYLRILHAYAARIYAAEAKPTARKPQLQPGFFNFLRYKWRGFIDFSQPDPSFSHTNLEPNGLLQQSAQAAIPPENELDKSSWATFAQWVHRLTLTEPETVKQLHKALAEATPPQNASLSAAPTAETEHPLHKAAKAFAKKKGKAFDDVAPMYLQILHAYAVKIAVGRKDNSDQGPEFHPKFAEVLRYAWHGHIDFNQTAYVPEEQKAGDREYFSRSAKYLQGNLTKRPPKAMWQGFAQFIDRATLIDSEVVIHLHTALTDLLAPKEGYTLTRHPEKHFIRLLTQTFEQIKANYYTQLQTKRHWAISQLQSHYFIQYFDNQTKIWNIPIGMEGNFVKFCHKVLQEGWKNAKNNFDPPPDTIPSNTIFPELLHDLLKIKAKIEYERDKYDAQLGKLATLINQEGRKFGQGKRISKYGELPPEEALLAQNKKQQEKSKTQVQDISQLRKGHDKDRDYLDSWLKLDYQTHPLGQQEPLAILAEEEQTHQKDLEYRRRALTFAFWTAMGEMGVGCILFAYLSPLGLAIPLTLIFGIAAFITNYYLGIVDLFDSFKEGLTSGFAKLNWPGRFLLGLAFILCLWGSVALAGNSAFANFTLGLEKMFGTSVAGKFFAIGLAAIPIIFTVVTMFVISFNIIANWSKSLDKDTRRERTKSIDKYLFIHYTLPNRARKIRNNWRADAKFYSYAIGNTIKISLGVILSALFAWLSFRTFQSSTALLFRGLGASSAVALGLAISATIANAFASFVFDAKNATNLGLKVYDSTYAPLTLKFKRIIPRNEVEALHSKQVKYLQYTAYPAVTLNAAASVYFFRQGASNAELVPSVVATAAHSGIGPGFSAYNELRQHKISRHRPDAALHSRRRHTFHAAPSPVKGSTGQLTSPPGELELVGGPGSLRLVD